MIFPIIPQFKQRLGLMCPADEIFLGGSLGGGKTLFIVLKAMKLGLEHKRLNIFIFRQTFEELKKSVIPEFIDKVPPVLFRYKSSERCGILPNGSRIFFCYLENEGDLARYQSTNMDVLIMDECTHNPEAYVIKLKRRNRSARKDFKAKSIFTGNPGGASHNYFKKRFIQNREPYKIYITEETKHLPKEQQITQCFIPAGLIDNVDLVKQDPSYVGRLLEMPEKDKEMYLYGNWDINAGQFFSEFDEKKHVISEPVPIRHDSTIIIGMDWGTSKPSAVIFCKINEDNSVVAYKEIYTMRSGEPDVGTNQNASEVADLIADSITEEEKNQIKYIVLDSACWQDHGNGRTIASIIRDTLKERHFHIQLLQASKARADGWQQMRWYLHKEVRPNIPFLQIHKNCKHLLRTLPDLVQDENKTGDLDCFIAGTKVTTISGDKNIEDITLNDFVLTPVGYKKVIKDGISGVGETLEVLFSNGQKLRGTKNHKIYIQGKGLVQIQDLKINDIIVYKEEIKSWKNLYTKTLNTAKEKVENIITQGLTENTTHFISRFGLIVMEKFLKAMLYIIKTLMLITISWKTYKCFLIKSIVYYITILEKSKYLKLLINGEILKRVKKYFVKMLKKCEQIQNLEDYRASYVEKSLLKELLIKDSVVLSVKRNIIFHLKKIVRFVVKNLTQKEILKKKLEPVHIVAVGNLEERTVYNLTVQGIRLYYANNILVTNTRQEDHLSDSLRYILKQMPKPVDYRVTLEDKIEWGVPATYPKIVKE